MPIGTTNIKLSDIQTEYGGSNPISLSEYYRGGSFVLAHPNNTGIPASGAISVSAFFNQRKEWVVAVTIAADVSDFNLRNFLNSTYGDFSSVPTIATVTINGGVRVYSTTTATPAFDTGSTWAAGSSVTIVNNGTIVGRGGNGANGIYGAGSQDGAAGSAGGNALNITLNTTINNGSGNIFGGGGGGGGSGLAWTAYITINNTGQAGGGGGAGFQAGPSTGGTNSDYVWYFAYTFTKGSDGTSGSLAGGGTGGTFNTVTDGGETPNYMYSGNGGNGGDFGAAGSSGTAGSYTGIVGNNHTPGPGVSSGGAGGAAGKAINLNGFAVTFTSGNNATQVKGAQS